MGESLLQAPEAENQISMEESVGDVPGSSRLEQSVSFGRFEHDSLCWERWSTFPSNKYLEEVEKCSTPGSVAKKAAYFEAHYKRIAARKAELLDQENRRQTELEPDGGQTQVGLMGPVSCEGELDAGNSNTQNSVYGIELENEVVEFAEEVKHVHVDVLCEDVDTFVGEHRVGAADSSDGAGIINEEEKEAVEFTSEVGEHSAEPSDGADIIEEHKGLAPGLQDACEYSCPGKESSEIQKPEEPGMVTEEDAIVSENKEEFPQVNIEEREMIKKATEDDVKLKNSKKTPKATAMKKTTNIANVTKKPDSRMPKRSAAPMPKSSMLSTPRTLKPAVSKTTMSTTHTSGKKENTLTPLTAKRASRPEIKRILPTSLHMSRSLEPENSDPVAVATTRKSLIMDRKGDKDIVKRAFKSFQNTSQRPPSNSVKAPARAQSATKKLEKKASATGTLQMKTERITRAARPSIPHTTQQATRKTSASSGVWKTTCADQRNGKSGPASLSSRSQDQGNKQKEVSKNLEQKSQTKQAGRTQLPANINAEKGANIKKPSQSKLSSSYNQEHGLSKRLHKG